MSAQAAVELPGFPAETAHVRAAEWRVAQAPPGSRLAITNITGLQGYSDAAESVREVITASNGSDPANTAISVVVDSVQACFEAEEILYELRDFVAGLTASPIGYLLSFVRTFSDAPECVMPDRRDITPATPCIDAYLRHLGDLCARRGALLTSDVEPVFKVFADESRVEAADLLQVPRGRITESGMRRNIDLVLRFLAADTGSDARVEAEFARAQLWQWVRHDTGVLDSGRIINAGFFETLLGEERDRLAESIEPARLDKAEKLLRDLTLAEDLADTMPL